MAGKDKTACSFCGITAAQAEFLLAKPDCNICGKCVYAMVEKLKDPTMVERTTLHGDCSFCSFMKVPFMAWIISKLGPPEESARGRKLIRGEKACICDDCVDVCLEAIEEHKARKEKKH